MNNKRLIIVSNRLPFQISVRKDKLIFYPSSGGLVTSITSYIEKVKGGKKGNAETLPLWIGTSDIPEKKFKKRAVSGKAVYENFILHPVFLPPQTKDKYYNGFCNDTIWPLFHYFSTFAKFNEEHWAEYVNANHAFCEKVLALYRPGDMIWIHDYHLMLLPALLREKLPGAAIGFFFHIPFPSFELFRLLPDKWRKDILKGLLGADLLGFHINDYVQYFIKSVQRILGYENALRVITTPDRSVTVDTFPVSIDYHKWNNSFNDEDVVAERHRIRKKLPGVKLIISVDRLDYAKGIINRLKGFELFLESHPDYSRKIVYILIVVPSRDFITQYMENKKDLEVLVSKINGRFGSIDWTPVVYQYKTLDFKKLCALYTVADIALITPLRDGMNLVAKEFIASHKDRLGVLILSETAGASVELGESIIINPTDIKEIASSVYRALNMPPEEQVERNNEMHKRLQNYDVVRWAEDFISQLLMTKEKQELLNVKEVTPQIEQEIVGRYQKSGRRIIFLDYDGTLVPFAKIPHLALPDENLLKLLRHISSDDKNTIVLISGRNKEVLDGWFGGLPLNLVAEHGAFYKFLEDKSWRQSGNAGAEWKTSVLPVMNVFAERCVGTFVEEKTLSLAWHYRNAEKELGFLRSRELINTLSESAAHLNFQVLEGNKVIEARTRGIDKGVFAAKCLLGNKYDFVMALGDDKTDEDLFRVIPGTGISIRVGLVQSLAKFNLRNQADVPGLLRKLAQNPVAGIV